MGEKEYRGIFCSMYPVSNYETGDFETYAGVNTYRSSVDAVNLKEISQYLDVALQEESTISYIFLGLEPTEIWTTSKCEEKIWDENLQQYLFSYIEANSDVTFQVMLPSPSMSYCGPCPL